MPCVMDGLKILYMKNVILVALTIILTSFYYFPFEFTFLPGYNTKMLLAGAGLVVLLFRLAQGQKASVDKDLFLLSAFAAVVSLCGVFSVIWNGTQDYTYASYLVSMWVWLGGAYTVVSIIRAVHGRASIFLLGNYVIAVCAIQCVLAIAIDTYPLIRNWVESFYSDAVYYAEKDRLYGIGAALDVAGMRFSAALVMIACIGSKLGSSLSKNYILFYVFSFLIITVLGNMVARTTIVGVALAVFYFLFVYNQTALKNQDQKRVLRKWLVFISILSVPLIVYLYKTDPTFSKNLRFAFEGFFSLVETGRWDVHSNNMLENMYIVPTDFKTWLIGDGYFNNPIQTDPYYTGVIRGEFYMGTDIGYLRFIFYFGLCGLFAFMAFFCKACQVCINKNGSNKAMFILLLALNFIVWFKVSTDVFLIFALFLCVDQNENEESEAITQSAV